MEQSKAVVVIATHKLYTFPEEEIYLPVQAGAAFHESLGYQSDAEGDNISLRNPGFCELTVLYWAWKNLSCDILGLAHYRRYLSWKKRPVSGEQLQAMLNEVPVLLPKKRHYWIETNESQYVHAHGASSLDALKAVIAEKQPQYSQVFEHSLQRTSGHRFNMFIMRRDLADAYCQWLFDLLFTLEERISGTPVDIPRLYGFLSERMLDCWLEVGGYAYRELPVYQTEKTNWLKKGTAFLKRKFFSSHRQEKI